MRNRITFQFPGYLDRNVVHLVGNLVLSGTTMAFSGSTRGMLSASINRISTGLYAMTMSEGFPPSVPQHPYNVHFDVHCPSVLSSSLQLSATDVDMFGQGGRVPTITMQLTSGSAFARVDPAPAVDLKASFFMTFRN